jgi:FlaG/FlaF family flagellin (archaellin)
MNRITITVAAGLLIAVFVCPGVPRAQSKPQAARPNISLKNLKAQVAALQTTVSSLQATVSSLQVQLQNFAVVDLDGTPVRGSSSLQHATRIDVGSYEVTFNQDLTFCAYQATIGDPADGSPTPGQIWVATRGGNSDAVFVRTTDSTGTNSDRSTYTCPVHSSSSAYLNSSGVATKTHELF